MFVVENNYDGLDVLATGAFADDGLTGVAPSGYSLISSAFYLYSSGRILGANVLPDITNGGAPVSDFFESPPPGGYVGALFSATYQPLSGGSDVTIYADSDYGCRPGAVDLGDDGTGLHRSWVSRLSEVAQGHLDRRLIRLPFDLGESARLAVFLFCPSLEHPGK